MEKQTSLATRNGTVDKVPRTQKQQQLSPIDTSNLPGAGSELSGEGPPPPPPPLPMNIGGSKYQKSGNKGVLRPSTFLMEQSSTKEGRLVFPKTDSTSCYFANGAYSSVNDDMIDYFEVNINRLSKKGRLSIGIWTSIFVDKPPEASKGHHCGDFQNSEGWSSDGHIHRNGNINIRVDFKFGKGDTVGCGVLIDSFNHRRIFYTLNGKFLGVLEPQHQIPWSAYVVPCISCDGKAEITASFGNSFKWDTSEYPLHGPPGKHETSIHSLPDEVLELIIQFSATFPAQAALNLTRVNRKWRDVADSNKVWQPLFLKRWDSQNPDLKAKNWKKLYRNRQRIDPGHSTGPGFASAAAKSSTSFIDNCSFDFGCPMTWNALKEDSKLGENVRRCDHCKSEVYKVKTKSELATQVALGRCVSLDTEKTLLDLLSLVTFTGRIVRPIDYDADDNSADDDSWD